MTDHDLATLVREHVQRDEPPFQLSPDTVMAVGRRTLVRRRARRGFAGIVVAAAAVAALPLMPWSGSHGGDDKTGIDPATQYALDHYDAQKMPELIESHVQSALGDGLDGLGAAVFTAGDDQGESLPPRYYDKASGMHVDYGGEGDRRVTVGLMHSRSEAEGDARKNCADDVAAGYAFTCTVSTAPNGDLVTTRVMAVRELGKDFPQGGWGALTREELRSGVPAAGDPVQGPIDPAEVFFMRTVESVHSETFLTTASETVRAPDLTTAQSSWKISPADLETIVTDPVLVMPRPPLGKGGCAWTWHADVSCAKDPSQP
jgi:hypothetical protein